MANYLGDCTRPGPCSPCSCAPSLCCRADGNTDFPYNVRWGLPSLISAWNSVCPSINNLGLVSADEFGAGPYYRLGLPGTSTSGEGIFLETQHCYWGDTSTGCNESVSHTCDFTVDLRMRVYQVGSNWRLVVAGGGSGYFWLVYFWAQFSDAVKVDADKNGTPIQNQLLTCPTGLMISNGNEAPMDSADMAIWKPNIDSVNPYFWVAAAG